MPLSTEQGSTARDPSATRFAQAAAGDAEALRELHEERHPGLCRLAAGLLHRTDWAEDVVQEAWIHVLALLGDGRLDPKLADAALRRTIVRQASSLLRRQRRREGLLRLFGPFSLRPAPAQEAADPLLSDRLATALQELPESLRVPLLLRELEGWSSEEIARTLDLTPSAVDQRVSRARRTLRERLLEAGLSPANDVLTSLNPASPRGEG